MDARRWRPDGTAARIVAQPAMDDSGMNCGSGANNAGIGRTRVGAAGGNGPGAACAAFATY
jgi:hypothetical protein